MKKRTLRTLSLAITFLGGTVFAQGGETLSLKDAEREALTNSPYYQKASAVESETSWGRYQSFAEGFLPQVEIGGQYFFAEQYSFLNVEFGSPAPIQFPEIYPRSNLNVDVHMDIFDGFKNVHELDAADRTHEAAQILENWSVFQVKEQVRLKFYIAMASKVLLEMANENVKTLEDHLHIVQVQLANGEATKFDKLRVEVQLSEANSDQLVAADNVAIARRDLAQTMGLKGDDRPLTGKVPAIEVDKWLSRIEDVNFADRPDLKAKKMQAQAALDQSAASGSFWAPKISLIGEYQFYNSPDYLSSGLNYTNDYRTDYYFGAAATWDIFDGGISLAKAKEAEQRAKEAQADLKTVQLEAPFDLDMWKRRLASSGASYESQLANVDKAKESVRLATLGFKAGTNTTTDVLDAELDKYRASAGVVRAELDILEAVTNLELAIGKRLTND